MKVEVLIGDTDFDRRTRLKQAIRHQRVTGTVDGDPSLSGTLRKLTRPDEFDVIFVSIDFGFDKISNFIKEAKYTKSGQDCAYIVTARQSDSDNSDIARSVVEGADGVLLEPFSAESMQEVIDLSMRIKRERKLARQRAAVGVVVKEIVKNLDLASDTLRDGRTPVTRMRALNGLHETLENLESDALPLYYEALLDSMGDAIPFRPMTKSDLGILPMTRPVLSVRMNEEHGQPELEVTLEFAEGEDADLSNSLTVTRSIDDGTPSLIGSSGDSFFDSILGPALEQAGLSLAIDSESGVTGREAAQTVSYGLGASLREMQRGGSEHSLELVGGSAINDMENEINVSITMAEDEVKAHMSLGRDLRNSKDKNFLLERSALRSFLDSLAEGGGLSIEIGVRKIAHPEKFMETIAAEIGKALTLSGGRS